MTELRGIDREKLCNALVDAYTDWDRLETMVRHVLNVNLEHKVGRVGGLDQIADKLIEWARSMGRLDELIEGAYERNSGNAKLKAFYECWQARCSVKKIPGVTQSPSAPPQHLLCDRTDVWEVLETAAKTAGGHIFFLCGKRGDGHGRFGERIKAFAAEALNAVVRPVKPQIFELPAGECDARHVLSDALGTSADGVEYHLAELLAERSVILLYPTIENLDQAQWLQRHDIQHLPELFSKIETLRGWAGRQSNGLVVVQSIRWQPSLMDSIPWFSRHWRTHRELTPLLLREDGGTFSTELKLSIWQKHLSPITKQHLDVFFSRIYANDPKARAAAMKRATKFEGRSADDIFDWLVEELQ